MQVFRCAQGFDRADFMAVGLDCKDQAGAHRFTIKEDGAGAADAMFAANVRADQAQVVAQEITQQQAGLPLRVHTLPLTVTGNGKSLLMLTSSSWRG